MSRDKKVDAGQIRWALPTAIGHAVMTRDVPLAVVEQVLINS
jgi:3-dehydroquinate synthase